ncbi:branched-chain amino acid ABC transporter substrate-binding protein [Desulfopila sp. IMCC35006]|uniref:branched-chain amino acid ABC transporter substrate-binding protein n=1 Tax=Desulfopila sp. IMCC35006 TaxID=2569542 RepID=UPI0010AD4A67|nr:branched-chain amino acid ABC transporter substrate-binding protein [Desulfopila sp. IMCC35006]TKB26640.1 branched-chain amino acid ABC transporter substrate-binding protein [Desulfopila sp. IMCC35006]
MLQSKALVLSLVASVFLVTPVFAAETLKVGVQAPITGAYANEGQGIDQSVRLLAEQINAKGGVMGRQIEVISCDDEGTAMKAAICAKDLVNKGVSMVIGSYTSTCAEAAQTTYFRAGVLQTSDGTSDTLTEHGYWTFFRNSFPNSAEATFAADYMVKVKKYQRIAILSDFSSYADGLATAVADSVKGLGGNIVSREKVKAGSQNFTPVLTQIKSKNPDVIFYAGYYSDGGLIRSQQKGLGITADFIGGDANDNVDFLKLAGNAAAGTYIINVPSPEILPYDLAKDFLKAYKAKYNMMPPSIWTILNVDGMRAFIHAMETNKSFDTKKAADYLHTLKDYPGITGPISFAPDGNRVGSGYMAYEIQQDGSYKIVHK